MTDDREVSAPQAALGNTGGPDTSSQQDSAGRKLLVRAFEKAKATGRADWNSMTTAVLKNRLLDLTGRAFREQDYGARNMAAFVRGFPDLLAVDESTKPPRVTLIRELEEPVGLTRARPARIRPDLWDAVVDYRSGRPYFWDGSQAIPADIDEALSLPMLPTLSEENLAGWRSEFASKHQSSLNEGEKGQLGLWADQGLPTRSLPPRLQNLWNIELNQHVAQRLSEWFEEQGIPTPRDMMQRTARGPVTDSVGVAQIRELVLRCVRVMTEDELRDLRLPPASVLRVYGGQSPRTIHPGEIKL